MVAQSQSTRIQSIPITVKLEEAIEIGKYFKFLLQSPSQPLVVKWDDITFLMKSAGQLMWPEKYDCKKPLSITQ